ncbi:MAG: Gfo/Idh/MocA family protein, partial [Planctomycetota bacterium]
MSNEKIRIGIVGAGGNTKNKHIPEFKKIDGVELVSVANRSLESSALVAEEFGIETAFGSWQDVVGDSNVDAVMIGTWPYMHKEVTIAALQNNKHVLCEARMAMNADEAYEMKAEADKHSDLIA